MKHFSEPRIPSDKIIGYRASAAPTFDRFVTTCHTGKDNLQGNCVAICDAFYDPKLLPE